MIETIARQQIGERRQAGTLWPVEDLVQRHAIGGETHWVLLKGLCNGVPSGSETYDSEAEAAAEFQKRAPLAESFERSRNKPSSL